MTLTATSSPSGFDKLRTVADHEVILWPGDPGVTFTKGDMVSVTGGVLVLTADSGADPVGRVAKTIVCPAAASAYFPIPGPCNGIKDLDGDDAKTLIPVEVDLPAGTKVFRGTFAGHKDDVVASINAATRSIGLTTGLGTDDYGIGALIYIYSGTGAGQLNIIEDYDHTGGNVELEVITHRWWKVAPSTDSNVIILSSAAASSDGRSLMGRMDLDDEDNLDMTDGYDDGNWLLYDDFMRMVDHLNGTRYQLTLPAIRAVHQLVSPNA